MSGNSTSLTRKALALSALILVPTLLAAALALRTSLNFMESAAFDTVEVQTIVAAQEVELWLSEQSAIVELVAGSPDAVDPLLNRLVAPAVSTLPEPLDAAALGLRSASIFTADGELVAASEDAPTVNLPMLSQTLETGMAFDTARRVARGDDRLLVFAEILTEEGPGVLAAEVPLDELVDVLPVDTPWDSGEIVVVQESS